MARQLEKTTKEVSHEYDVSTFGYAAVECRELELGRYFYLVMSDWNWERSLVFVYVFRPDGFSVLRISD